MATMDIPLIEKKSPKIKELSDFNEIFNVHLLMNEWMNEFYNTSVILPKILSIFSQSLNSSHHVCVALFNR